MVGGHITSLNVEGNISTTTSYFQDDITWCVPIAKQQPLVFNMLYLLELEMWFVHVVLDAVMGSIFFYILRFDRVLKCFAWNVILFIEIGMGIPVVYTPKNTLARFVFILCSIYGLEWSTVFSSFLISTLTKPQTTQQVDNVMKALQYNYEFIIPSSYYIQNDLNISI